MVGLSKEAKSAADGAWRRYPDLAPNQTGEKMCGGHEITAVSFDEETRVKVSGAVCLIIGGEII